MTKGRLEKFKLERDSNPDLCDVGAVLFQLSFQVNWKLFIMWGYDKSVDNGYRSGFESVSYTHLTLPTKLEV